MNLGRHNPKITARMGIFLRIIKDLFPNISKHDVLNLSAALAFYTALSLSPVLVIVLWFFKHIGVKDQQAVVDQMVQLVGPQAGKVLGMVIENTKEAPELGTMAGIFGFLALLVSAGGVFGQLQASLNRIFEVAVPDRVDWWVWLQKRLLSLGMVFSLGFVAVVSLGVSAAISFLSDRVVGGMFGTTYLAVAEVVGSLIVFGLFFACLFKVLPDTKISWKESLLGGLLTALLFSIGKRLIGLYLGHSSVGSSYGAAASVVILLVWIYYSSAIVFIGAELTQLCNKHFWGRDEERPSQLDKTA